MGQVNTKKSLVPKIKIIHDALRLNMPSLGISLDENTLSIASEKIEIECVIRGTFDKIQIRFLGRKWNYNNEKQVLEFISALMN